MCTLPVACSDHSHPPACAYALSRESRTPKHTLRCKPWDREDFLPQEVPEHTLHVAFLHFKALGRGRLAGAGAVRLPLPVRRRASYSMTQK